jgi:hypothetical protein
MSQRLVLLAVSMMAFMISAVAQNPAPTKPPEHVRYYFVFRHLALLNQKAVEAEKRGEDGKKFREHYKNYAKLNDGQVDQLNQVAADCLLDIAPLDARIKQMVAASRARVPDRKIAPSSSLPEPTAELKELDKERDQIMRRAYTRLREAFGEAEFNRFSGVIEKSVRLSATPVGAREGGPRKLSISKSQTPKQ